MSSTAEQSPGAAAIRPFTVEIPEAEIQALRARIAATRWPEKEPVDDLSQGVTLAAIQALARYWQTGYDFGRLEARLSDPGPAGHPLRCLAGAGHLHHRGSGPRSGHCGKGRPS